MDLSLTNLLMLARDSVQRPRETARVVLRANLPMNARWVAFALMAVMSALLAHVSFSLLPAADQETMAVAMFSPVTSAVTQGILMLAASGLIHFIGRFLGGQGQFQDALMLMIWLQFILLIVQVVQIAVQIVAPPVVLLVGYVSVTLFLWLLSNFVAELHGFRSSLKTFGGILLTMLAIGFTLAVLLSALIGTPA